MTRNQSSLQSPSQSPSESPSQSRSRSSSETSSFTCFAGNRRVASGSLQRIAVIFKQFQSDAPTASVLVFDDATGRTVDIDTRGSEEEMLARLAICYSSDQTGAPAGVDGDSTSSPSIDALRFNEGRGRGRPKLGVVPREVTLLPRHWEWLATQPGGASVALRRLVEEARRIGSEKDRIRQAHERSYHFMSAIAGNLPGFEEAIRALFAHDQDRFSDLLAAWPADIRDHAVRLGFGTGS